ncbi:MAG: GGDEF domain-containing protein [Anaerolineales bacterium]|nr:GGDEF domain-containing protein [Anaerolineales bacterium]
MIAREAKRHTVGVLFNSHVYTGMYPNMFASTIIRGIQAAARDQSVNLLAACGVSHGAELVQFHPAWPELLSDTDFIPVGPWNTDGLLVFSPLHSQERIRYIRRLQDQLFPVYFIGSGAGSPSITVDNEGGIRQTLEHLVSHGHRDIAFIAGDPEDPGDSAARIRAYQLGVREFGLADDPRLMEYGQHWDQAAYHAVRRILKSGVKFTAVMCSNDQSALGVMRALHEAGSRIPWDVAVTGFDDQPEALTLIPPLTSVHYPLFETGYRALLMMRKRIEDGPGAIPDVARVYTQLMTRQSCGCLPQMNDGALGVHEAALSADKGDFNRYREDLGQAMIETLISHSSPQNISDTRMLCDRLIDAYLHSLADEDLSHFQVALMEILQRIEILEEDPHAWQSAITVLRLCARIPPAETVGYRNALLGEDLLHQARTLISDSARRQFTRLHLLQTRKDEALGRLTARLLSSLDEQRIFEALKENLPQVGIRECHVMYFEPRGEDPYGGSVQAPLGRESPDLRFESRRFPPPGIFPEDKPFNLAILPLFFQQENLGYAAFDGQDLDSLAIVAVQLATAIKSAQLHGKVLELSLTDGLTSVHNRRFFEILLEKEIDRSRRYSRNLAVIMADIDLFKTYNDSFGHQAGDEALREIAQCIRDGARRGLDVVTRYGGEEFALILPETDEEGAWIVAEKIRRTVASDSRFLRRITVSLGIASMHGEQLDARMLVEQADRALYQAKNRGRDCTVRFESGMIEAAHPGAPGD